MAVFPPIFMAEQAPRLTSFVLESPPCFASALTLQSEKQLGTIFRTLAYAMSTPAASSYNQYLHWAVETYEPFTNY